MTEEEWLGNVKSHNLDKNGEEIDTLHSFTMELNSGYFIDIYMTKEQIEQANKYNLKLVKID